MGRTLPSEKLRKELREMMNNTQESQFSASDLVTRKDAVLCAWGITREGQKVLLHLALGQKESYKDWLELLRNMARRRRTPVTSFDLLSLDRLREALGIENGTIGVQHDFKEARQ